MRRYVIIATGILFVCGVLAALPYCAATLQGNTARQRVTITDLERDALPSVIAQDKRTLTPAQRKIDSQLLQAIRQRRAPRAQRLEVAVEIDNEERAVVDISARVSPELLERIRMLGGIVVSHFERYHTIRAHVPLNRLETLAGHADVRFIMPAARAMTNESNSGSVVSP